MDITHIISYEKKDKINDLKLKLKPFSNINPNFSKISIDYEPIEINNKYYYKIQYNNCAEIDKENMEQFFNNFFDDLKIKLSNRRYHDIYIKILNIYNPEDDNFEVFSNLCCQLLNYEFYDFKKQINFVLLKNTDKYILRVFCKKRKIKKIIQKLTKKLEDYYNLLIYN